MDEEKTPVVDVTDRVAAWLKEKMPMMPFDKWLATGQRVLVPLDVDKPAFNRAVEKAFANWSMAVHDFTMFEDVMASVVSRAKHGDVSADDNTSAEVLKREFTRPYRGDLAPTKLQAFVDECWANYRGKTIYRFPYTTVVQSSGFGKSRLLLELAMRTKDTQGSDAHMRVVYTCVRDKPHSTGYPVATRHLNDYFFPTVCDVKSLEDRLCLLFDLAMSRWESVGNDWLDLFTDTACDA